MDVLTFLVVALGVIATLLQLRELRKQQAFIAFERLMEEIGSEEARSARERIHKAGEPFSEWDTEVTKAAEMTAVRFDRVGFLVLNGLADKEQIMDWTGEMVYSMWVKLKEYVEACRKQEGRKNWVPYFERLAKEASIKLSRG